MVIERVNEEKVLSDISLDKFELERILSDSHGDADEALEEGLGDKSLQDDKRIKTQMNLSNPRRETTCEVTGGFQSNRAWVNNIIYFAGLLVSVWRFVNDSFR